MDENVVIENSATGMHLTNISGLSLTSAVVIRDNTNIGIEIYNCDTPTLDNLTLTGNGGTHGAIYLNNVGEFTLGNGNIIGGTGLENSWAVTITLGSYPSASCVIPTTGNTNNDIQVRGGSSDRTGVWRKYADLDYILTINPSISVGGGLTIEDEVNVLFNSGVRLNVYGTLTAVGSPAGGILFSRSGASNGTGLRFLGDSTGTFDYCTVEYGTYGVYTISTGTITIANTTIEHCGYGIDAANGGLHFLNIQILNNTSYGIYLDGATPYFGNNEDEWNDIYNNGGGNAGRNLRNGPTDIDAQYVYWGAIDEPTIQYGIWDENDDLDLGLVNYTPWCTAAHDTTLVGVPEQQQPEELPKQFALAENYPNPFNPATTIQFSLAAPAPVRLTIYDVSGALVTTLVDRTMPVGNYRITWRGLDRQGREVASGVYLYTIAAGDFHQTRRMMLIR
jgi:hypothetical protein